MVFLFYIHRFLTKPADDLQEEPSQAYFCLDIDSEIDVDPNYRDNPT